MKKQNTIGAAALAVILALSVVSCASTTAPTAVERALFTTTPITNSIPTNWVETVTVTNATGEVVTDARIVSGTNVVVSFQFEPKSGTLLATQTAAAVGGIYAPGWGELIGVVLMAIVGGWAKLRSQNNKSLAVQATLAQGVETLLAVLENTPQGRVLTDKLKLELVKHQQTAGVLAEVAKLVEATVDNQQAKAAAKLVLDSLPK